MTLKKTFFSALSVMVAACAAGTENWKRLARHWFTKRRIDALRITCFDTWGDRSAQIFEVRVY